MLLRIVGRVELDQVDDVEAGAPQQAEQLAVRDLPLDALRVGPLEAPEAALGALEGRAELLRLEVGRAEDRDRAVAQEPEPTARPQEAVGLGDPLVGVAPDARAVLRP